MKKQTKRARRLAILVAGIAVWLGWVDLGGGVAYAQYSCVLSCSASGPATGTAGTPISFSATTSTYYCQGNPTYSWDFGDGATGSGSNSSHTYAAAGIYTWSVTVTVDDATASRSGGINITSTSTTKAVTGVSAASYDGSALSSEEIVAAFGAGFSTNTQAASSIPLPTALAGASVKVKDSLGVERAAPLFFVSPTQINYEIPPGTAGGAATMTVTGSDGALSVGTVQIAGVAPSLFTANSSGQGVPSGYVLRVRADSSQSIEPIAIYDAAQGKYVSAPIDLGPATDQVFVVLFGTGFRFRSALSGVSVQLGGVNAGVLFAGAQGDLIGLDQLNALVPRSLAGRGEIDWVTTVDGKPSNTVRINIK
jgi:uncharacterized protein (TIGR03437 family)